MFRNPKKFYVIKDMRTLGFFIKQNRDCSSEWSLSPFLAAKYKTEEAARKQANLLVDNRTIILEIDTKV